MHRFLWIGLAIALATLTIACSTADSVSPPTLAQASTQPAAPQPDAAQPDAALIENLKSDLSAQTGIAQSDIVFKSATATQWPDSCLGVAKPDEMCAQVITPGYQITLSTPMRDYEFHTDRSGQRFRMVPTQGAQPQ